MKKEIYRSFDVLEVGGDRTGYIVYQTPNWYQIEWKSIEPEVSERKFRIKNPIDWTDLEAVSNARWDVDAANIEGQAYYKGKWYGTDTILKIMKAHQSYYWKEFV